MQRTVAGRHLRHRVLAFQTHPWPAGLRAKLLRQLDPETIQVSQTLGEPLVLLGSGGEIPRASSSC